MDDLKKYFDLQQKIYDYFGYVEDWVVIPLEDSTRYNWVLIQGIGGGGRVWYSEAEFTPDMIRDGSQLYSCIIYTQRFLPRWVHRADDYAMICADTQTDGNKFLMVFDNSKELSNPGDDILEALEEW